MADFWDDQLVELGIADPPPIILPPTNGHNGNGHADPNDARSYGLVALRREADALAICPEGQRNDQLNRAAFNLASLVEAGALSAEEVDDALTSSARSAGLGETEIAATLASGRRGSAQKVGARVIPERAARLAAVPPVVRDEGENTCPGCAEPPCELHPDAEQVAAAERLELHRLAVQRRAYELRINDEARDLWTAQRAALLGQQPPPLVSLPDMLAIPDEAARYRCTDLWPIGGRVLLAAQYKAGKTSLIANLLRSLVDGDDFLGRYATEAVGRVVLIDTELDERMLRAWLRDQNIRNRAAISVLSMRGQLSSFGILDDRTRADWAERIAGADVVMLDCLRPCLDALGLSEDKEAGRFLVAFDSLCTEAGAAEAVVVHHMGHSQERSRGDSRLLDWPDVLWKIVRDTDDEGENIESGDRFFSAIGRDVNVPESLLDWNPQTRGLMVCGGGRAEKKARNSVAEVVEVLRLPGHADGLTHRQLVAALGEFGVGRNVARKAIKQAIEDGVVIGLSGPHNSNIHILNPSRRQGV